MVKQPKILAIIDLGSNSFYMKIVRVLSSGHIVEIMRHKQQVQLRSGIDSNGELTAEIEQKAFACFRQFAQYLQKHRVDAVRIIGTYTLRKAKRKGHFLAEGENILGYPIQVVSGTEEARLIYVGATHKKPLDRSHLVVDIGGGSTELIIGEQNRILASTSLGMGCVSFQNQFFPDGQLTGGQFEKAIQAAKHKLQSVLPRFTTHHPQDFLGSSGTVLTISGVLERYANSPAQTISRAGLDWLYQKLRSFKTVKHIALQGLREDRVAILPGGFCVLFAIFDCFQIDKMTLSAGGIREGSLHELIKSVCLSE